MARVSQRRLPSSRGRLIGREDELAWLDRGWASHAIKVQTIIAWGGVGKTALVDHWRTTRLAAGEFEVVFEWSFYSQGVREQQEVSADAFLREALVFFGEQELADSKRPARDKALGLAAALGRERALLILDGLEPLQHPPTGAGSGALREQSIAVLLRQQPVPMVRL